MAYGALAGYVTVGVGSAVAVMIFFLESSWEEDRGGSGKGTWRIP